MSVFVLAPECVWNPALLRFSTAPRKILQRGLVLPRRDAGWRFVVRTIFESLALRCGLTLAPLGIIAYTWPMTALPIGQAPVLMLVMIGFVELRLVRIPRHRRDGLISEADAARTLDTLQFRGRRVLTELAAARGIERGTLYLVVEQSDMGRLPPLTIASLQLDTGKSRLVALTQAERAIVRQGLFDDTFTERQLLMTNLREGVTLRSVAFEARGVSAHARLAAYLDHNPPAEAPAV